MRVIFDCDNTMGLEACDFDDGLSLLYLLGSKNIDLLGITCSFGNSTQNAVYDNTCQLVNAWGLDTLKVVKGAISPDCRISEASHFLVEQAERYVGELHLLATGSLSNLLGAYHLDPLFFEKIASISLMGGITQDLLVGDKPMDELNFSVDPEAALTVLQKGKNVRIATAQSCLDSYFPEDEFWEYMDKSESPVAKVLPKLMKPWLDYGEKVWGLKGYINWDILAASQLVKPELFYHNTLLISPSLDSLHKGYLLAKGPKLEVSVPQIINQDEYRQHIYETILSAKLNL